MPRKTQKIVAVRVLYLAKPLLPSALSTLRRFLTAIRRTNPSANSGSTRCPETGVKRMGIEGGKLAPPLVATVTVNGEGALLATDTLEGT
jgi:hypothetical protein